MLKLISSAGLLISIGAIFGFKFLAKKGLEDKGEMKLWIVYAYSGAIASGGALILELIK